MKAVQIEVEDELLNYITQDKEFPTQEVSVFFNRAAKFLVKWRTEYKIKKQFERAYSDPHARDEFDREMKEWIDEQVWID